MGVIRMGLPTASFLPGGHMVRSRRGTREVSQSGSGAFRANLKGGDMGAIKGGSQDQVAPSPGSSQNCPCICTALISLARKVLRCPPHVHSFTHSKAKILHSHRPTQV